VNGLAQKLPYAHRSARVYDGNAIFTDDEPDIGYIVTPGLIDRYHPAMVDINARCHLGQVKSGLYIRGGVAGEGREQQERTQKPVSAASEILIP
jgi:hypothetical protein